ncbi:prepilin-type N-terminal cleavage/methylation domain-containing protein [Meiothermus sp. QL-1]|uniref:type IV pilus modification PilV family protein n=1 Tax=Meiothermus sp. QL-1 TaxID=2058095 RepID=UPI000E0AB2D7|nr:prepilin-type N-terminal cleavage/methylation domain-containing protein [Meiothermus sp. QL-1]RDI95149.1 prepilin-type N-terminal cleavage/methylation domain-containing protein [Meiothermus sp. QL-1]
MRRSGFSFVEVMVALAVVSITILMLTYFGSSFTLTRNAQIDTQAQAYARSYFDNLRALWSSETAFEAAALPSLPLPVGFADLRVEQEDAQTLGQQVVLRRVTLSFSGPQGRSYRFTTEVVRPPL